MFNTLVAGNDIGVIETMQRKYMWERDTIQEETVGLMRVDNVRRKFCNLCNQTTPSWPADNIHYLSKSGIGKPVY